MSHFYGTLRGHRGEATRCGSKDAGVRTVAASWEGAIKVSLSHDEAASKDMARVAFTDWHGRGINQTIYEGPVDGGPLHPHPLMELLVHCVDEKVNKKTVKGQTVRLSLPLEVYDKLKAEVMLAITGRE